MTDPRLLPGKKFKLSAYLQSAGKGQYGGVRDPLRTSAARIEYARRYGQFSQPLTQAERIESMSPKGDLTKKNAFLDKQQADQTKAAEELKKKMVEKQQRRISGTVIGEGPSKGELWDTGTAGMTPEELLAYRQKLENQRLGGYGEVRNATGKSLQSIEQFQQGQGTWYEHSRGMMSMMSPAEMEARIAQLKTYTDAADFALWHMANFEQMAFATPEQYGEFRGYMAAWMQARGTTTEDLWDVPGLIGKLAFDDIVPSPLNVLVGVGALKDGQILTMDEAAEFSIDISSFKYTSQGNVPDPTLKVNVDAQGNVSLVVSSYLNADGTAVQEIPISNEEYRVRDFTVDQTLTLDEAKHYFDITNADPSILYKIREIQNADGNRTMTVVGQVMGGWTINFNEGKENTYTAPNGTELTQTEYDSFNANLKKQNDEAIAAFDGSSQGGVWADLILNTKWKESLWLGGTAIYTPKEGNVDAFGNNLSPDSKLVPINMWSTPLDLQTLEYSGRGKMVDAVVNGISGMNVTVFGETKAQDATYFIPNPNSLFNDNNLPDYIVKGGIPGTSGYSFDISTAEGALAFSQTYPLEYMSLIKNMGETEATDKWLKDPVNGYGWTDQQVSLFWKVNPASSSMRYDPNTMEPMDVANADNPLSFFNVLAAGIQEVINGGANVRNDLGYLVGGMFEDDPTLRQETGNFVVNTALIALGARVGAAETPAVLPGNIPLNTFIPLQLQASTLVGTGIKMYTAYNLGLDLFDAVAEGGNVLFNGVNEKDREFVRNLGNAFKTQGFGAFLRNDFHNALKESGTLPKWIMTFNEVAAGFAPFSTGFIPIRLPEMPIFLRSVRTGGFTFVKSIDSWADFETAAAYKGYQTIRTGIKDRYMMIANGEAIPINSLVDANNFFKFGNTYGVAYMRRILRPGAIQFDLMTGGKKIPYTVTINEPATIDSLIDTISWGKLVKKSPSYIKGDVDSIINSIEELKLAGAIKPEDIAKFAWQVEFMIRDAGKAAAQHYVSEIDRITNYPLTGLKGAERKIVNGRFPEDMFTSIDEGAPLGKDGKPILDWNTVFQYSKYYHFKNPNINDWIVNSYNLIDSMTQLASHYGIEFNRVMFDDALRIAHYFPRNMQGKEGYDLLRKYSNPEKERVYEFMEDSLNNGGIYGLPHETLQSYVNSLYAKIAREESNKFFEPWEKLAASETEMGQYLIQNAEEAKQLASRAGVLERVLQRARRGEKLPAATLHSIERNFPDIATRLKEYMKSKDKDAFDSLLSDVREIKSEADIFARGQIKTKTKFVKMQNRKAFTEGSAGITRFQGKIFVDQQIGDKLYSGDDIAKILRDTFQPKIDEWLKFVHGGFRFITMAKTGLDASAPLTIGKMLMGEDISRLVTGRMPNLFLKSTGIHLLDMISPKYLNWYHGQNYEIFEDFIPYGLKTASEQQEFYEGLDFMRGIINKHPNLKSTLDTVLSPYGATGRGWAGFGEIARVEIIKSQKASWLRQGGSMLELAEFSNIVTCTLPQMAKPVRPTMNLIEGCLALAPNMLRTTLMMFGRMAKGGVMGKELTKMFLDAEAGWTAAYVALWYATDQKGEPHIFPWDSKYLTFEIDGRQVGIGGPDVSLIRAIAQTMAVAYKNPKSLIFIGKDGWRSTFGAWGDALSPLEKYAGYKMSPPVSYIKELITQRDFMGRKLDGQHDMLMELAKVWIPIIVENIVIGEMPKNPISYFSIIFGGKEYPTSDWTRFTQQADSYVNTLPDSILTTEQRAKKIKGELTWADMGVRQSVILAENDDLNTLYEKAKASSLSFKSDQYLSWKPKHDALEAEISDWENSLLNELRAGVDVQGKPFGMKEYMQARSDKNKEWAGRRVQLQSDYKELYASWDAMRATGEPISANFDRAYNQWYDYVWGTDTQDSMGNTIWSIVDARKADWIKTWGQDYYDMLREVQSTGFKDSDPFQMKIWEATALLNDTYYKIDPTDTKAREAFRKDPMNIEVEATLAFLGKITTFLNPAAEELVHQWCKEYNVPESTIPALSAFLLPDEMATKYNITDPSLWRQYQETVGSETGWDKQYFLKQHREIYNYLLGEKIITAPIKDFTLIPEPDEHALLEQFAAIEGDNADTLRMMWRCTNELGDAALVRYEGKSPLYGGNKCRVFLAKQGTPAQQASAAQQYFNQ